MGGNEPRVSTIIPVYNGARTVSRAIESVLSQTYDNTELLVIDDGSTDDTASVISARFPHVRCLRQANSGPAVARNRGVEAAIGEYIAFLDADDRWMPEKLQRQMEFAMQHPGVGLLATNCLHAVSEEQMTRDYATEHTGVDQKTLRSVLHELGGARPSTWFLRRELFLRLGGFSYHVFPIEDLEFLLKLTSSGHTVLVLRSQLCVVDLSDQAHYSGRRNSKLNAIRHVPELLARFDPAVSENASPLAPSEYVSLLGRQTWRLATWAVRLGAWGDARHLLRAALSAGHLRGRHSTKARALLACMGLAGGLLGSERAPRLCESLCTAARRPCKWWTYRRLAAASARCGSGR